MGWLRRTMALPGALAVIFTMGASSQAETINSALARAYRDNPQLNAERAKLRATDENVPQALSGYRPRLGVVATVGEQSSSITETNQVQLPSGRKTTIYTPLSEVTTPYSYGISATQTLYNGFQTANKTRTSESQVLAEREGLRVLEQTLLLNAATVYMDVLRDSAIVQIDKSNVDALNVVLSDTLKRFQVNDVTETDVSQAQAQLAQGESALMTAESNLRITKANYKTIIGVEPTNLSPASPVDRFSLRTLPLAIDLAAVRNPNVTAAMYGVDVAYLQVKINEGALLPTFTVQATLQRNSEPSIGLTEQNTASIIGQLSIPLYQGGGEYSLIRQSKETVAQQRLNLDLVRRQVMAAVITAWSQLLTAKGVLEKAQLQVSASERAVNGVRKELSVGERTTFDLLNAQQALVQARIILVTAQHDRVVASYSVLSAVGKLSPDVLGLPTPVYNPIVHYEQVRDVWFGVRAPSGQ